MLSSPKSKAKSPKSPTKTKTKTTSTSSKSMSEPARVPNVPTWQRSITAFLQSSKQQTQAKKRQRSASFLTLSSSNDPDARLYNPGTPSYITAPKPRRRKVVHIPTPERLSLQNDLIHRIMNKTIPGKPRVYLLDTPQKPKQTVKSRSSS